MRPVRESSSFMPNAKIHPSTSLGPDVHVAEGAEVGPNCFLSGRISIAAGAQLVGGITWVGDAEIGERCIIEPGVTLSHLTAFATAPLRIGADAHVGAGSVLASGLTIGVRSRIAAGTVVTRNVPSHAIVQGNPATIVGYGSSIAAAPGSARFSSKPASETSETQALSCTVKGVRIFRFPRIRDLRGDLTVGEFGRNVPFEPKRFFLVYDVPSAETRGEHAHKACHQFLICVAGYVAVVVDDGRNREEIELDAPNIGLYIPPKVWGVQYKYSSNATLLVFASHFYDPDDYIRDYNEFLANYVSAS